MLVSVRHFALSLLVLAAGGIAAGGMLAGRLLAEPQSGGSVSRPGASGFGVQQGLAELLLRSGRVSARTEPIVIEDGDLNAFLARHFHARRLTLEPLYVRAGAGWLEVTGRTSARRVTASSGSKVWRRILPGALLDLEVWLSVRGRLAVVGGAAEVTIDRVVIGRQSVPPSWLWGLTGLDPGELLAWRIPPVVERIAIEPGRVVIHTRPGRG